MKQRTYIALILMLFFLPALLVAQTRVVCVGNSVTAGYTLSDPNTQSWPARLGSMLGSKYTVYNCGVSGTTMLKNGSSPYWNTSSFNDAKNHNPDILIIALGTNDAHPSNWVHQNDFYNDYASMIDAFRQNGRNPAIYVCYPVTAYGDGAQIANLQNGVIPIVNQISIAKGASIINLNTPTQNQRNSLYNDNLHPNVSGALVVANTVFNTITPVIPAFFRDCNYGGAGMKLEIGDYNFSALSAKGIFNNDISSIKVPQGYKVFGYVDDNFTGNYVTLTSDNSCLGGWDNLITSVRIRANGVTGKNGTFSLQNRNSGKYIDVAGGSAANGANILQWQNTGNTNQQFTFTDVGDGAYSIISAATGKSLDVAGGSSNNASNILQWTYGGALNQKFILLATDNNFFKFKAAHSGRIVEVFGAGLNNGDNIGQFDDNSQYNGQWKLNSPGATQGLSVRSLNQNMDTSAVSEKAEVTLYPNPATNSIILKNVPAGIVIRILDINGKILTKKSSGKGGFITIDVNDLKPATYVVKIGNEKTTVLKFIKN